jgi:dethiobiotin synthetase
VFLVVEGVGGFKVPLGRTLDTVNLARAFNLPIVMVVGLRLGCLNHALLTAGAIKHEGFRLAGWIGSSVDPDMNARDENIDALRRRLGAPCLGVLPYSSAPDAAALASELDVTWLLS